MLSQLAALAIIFAALAGILFRPFAVSEALSAMAGAAALLLCGLLPLPAALHAAAQGWNLYLFLAGMMLLAELAAVEGVFDWAACRVARAARGSALRLFAYVYALAVLITIFLSNDATAVVFTPAVAVMARHAKARRRLPYLLICAFVANAASFVLPISNPANLVVYGAAMPDLAQWLRLFALPSALAILATFLLLLATQAKALRDSLTIPDPLPLAAGGRLTLAGLGVMVLVLLAASAAGWPLGPPSFAAGVASCALVLLRQRRSPLPLLRGVSWSVLGLAAGLFIMLGALDRMGLAAALSRAVGAFGAFQIAASLAILCNLVNNLPAGLVAGHALAGAAPGVKAAALIAVDLGPNLSVTGSLATILWLTALQRQGETITAWRFLRLGLVMMPPVLAVALYALQFAV